MLLTDQDYPRCYGSEELVYYLVLRPNGRPIFVDGFEPDTYQISAYSRTWRTEWDLQANKFEQMPVPAQLLAQIPEFREGPC